MNSKAGTVMKYVGSAMAVGGAVMLGSGMMQGGGSIKKKAKKTANKAIDTMDGIISGVQNIIK